jgi:V/A-type H+-transporting ATPase subunit A
VIGDMRDVLGEFNNSEIIVHNQAGVIMYELVEVGNENLIGEIIRLEGERATIQVYQNTTGLKVGEPVLGTGSLLSVELAPGLVGNVFDGIQRPLEVLRALTGFFIKQVRGVTPLSKEKKWHFKPRVEVGAKLVGGDTVGTVQETDLVEHRIMVPPLLRGTVDGVSPEGDYTITEPIATLEESGARTEIAMLQKWPVRRSRPYSRRLPPSVPLITGQRIIDTFFPIAKGGIDQLADANDLSSQGIVSFTKIGFVRGDQGSAIQGLTTERTRVVADVA